MGNYCIRSGLTYSITPSRALCASGVSVKTVMPGWTGQAQDATGFGASGVSRDIAGYEDCHQQRTSLDLDKTHPAIPGNL